MPRKLNEFRYPSKSVDYNNLKNADAFWGWSLQNAAKAAQLNEFPHGMKSISDVILWLNTAAQTWNRMQQGKMGESDMKIREDIREAIRKIVRKQLIETIAKYKMAKVPQLPVTKGGPKPKVDRDFTKEDEVTINKQAIAQDKEMDKDGKSGVPTDKEWKRFRNAEEPESVATYDETVSAWRELIEKIGKDLEEMNDLSEKLDDKMICDLLKEAGETHFAVMQENKERYKFIKLQYALRPIAARLKAALISD